MRHTHSPSQPFLHFTLTDGCELTVVQADHTQQCALALSFSAGSHNEPVEYLGVAHFLEHLVFRGSSNYAADDGLMAFIQRHGGQVNAQTQAQKTLFHFQIESSLFLGALERLVDMLVSPRLEDAMLVSEREVLNEEFHLYCQAPQVLMDAALAVSLLEKHPLQSFYAGNRQTLNIEDAAFRPALVAFHQAAYLRSQLKIVLVLPDAWSLWQEKVLPVLQPLTHFQRDTQIASLADLVVPKGTLLKLQLPVAEQYFVLHVPVNRNAQGLLELAEKMQHALAMRMGQSFLTYAEQQGWCSAIVVRAPYVAQEQGVLTIQVKRLAGALDGFLFAFRAWLQQWGEQLHGAELVAYELQAQSNRWLSADPLRKAQLLLSARWPLTGVSAECLAAFAAVLAAVEQDAFVQVVASSETVQGVYDRGLPLHVELLQKHHRQTSNATVVPCFTAAAEWADADAPAALVGVSSNQALTQHQSKYLPADISVCYWGWLVDRPHEVVQRLQAKLALLLERFSYNAVYWQLELLPHAVFIRIAAPANYLPVAVNQLLVELECSLLKASNEVASPFALRRVLQQLPAILIGNSPAEIDTEIALVDWPQAALWLGEAAVAGQLEQRFLQRLQNFTAIADRQAAATGWQHVSDSSADALLVLYIPLALASAFVMDQQRIINKVFAQQFQSILQRRLRDELGLCYAVFVLPHVQIEREGLVCAVQSSKVSALRLLAEIKQCLVDFESKLSEHVPALLMNAVQQIEQLRQLGQSLEYVSQRLFRHWSEQRLVTGWQDEIQAASLLTAEDIEKYYLDLQDQKRWLLLSNQIPS